MQVSGGALLVHEQLQDDATNWGAEEGGGGGRQTEQSSSSAGAVVTKAVRPRLPEAERLPAMQGTLCAHVTIAHSIPGFVRLGGSSVGSQQQLVQIAGPTRALAFHPMLKCLH